MGEFRNRRQKFKLEDWSCSQILKYLRTVDEDITYQNYILLIKLISV